VRKINAVQRYTNGVALSSSLAIVAENLPFVISHITNGINKSYISSYRYSLMFNFASI